jgi:hypothetical protein
LNTPHFLSHELFISSNELFSISIMTNLGVEARRKLPAPVRNLGDYRQVAVCFEKGPPTRPHNAVVIGQ